MLQKSYPLTQTVQSSNERQKNCPNNVASEFFLNPCLLPSGIFQR